MAINQKVLDIFWQDSGFKQVWYQLKLPILYSKELKLKGNELEVTRREESPRLTVFEKFTPSTKMAINQKVLDMIW